MPEAVVIIPARWGSSRFPGKVLAPLGGRPLVLHACSLARTATAIGRVLVATDSPEVAQVVQAAGFEAVMTDPGHTSGTDRVAEAASGLDCRVVVGLQADEPFLQGKDLDALVQAVCEGARLATLSSPLTRDADFIDPNVVKVVTTAEGRALYFSRSPIPYPRPESGPFPFPPGPPCFNLTQAHLGVYAWEREALLAFARLGPSPLERAEGLEQLRALEQGWTIRVLPARGEPCGVDTPEDLFRAEAMLARLTRTANP